MEKTDKTLQEVMDEQDRKTWGTYTERRQSTQAIESERRQSKERILPVQRLKLVRDGSIKYNLPKAPMTSPEHCLEIFRTFFNGADKEIVGALSLNMQNEYLNLSAVAFGTIGHVIVHPREVFKNVLAKDNAAKFIMAHNHPSGNPTPSPEDFQMMEEIRDLGIRLGCRLIDFVIIGDGNDSYYSHRELHYDYF